MKKIIIAVTVLLMACNKDKQEEKNLNCDMSQVYTVNAAKATVINGIWGTVSEMSGNCMPVYDPGPYSSCKHCPLKRTVQIYPYTTITNAVPASEPAFYTSFSTTMIKQVVTDNEGFYQTDLPAGTYTVVIVENGKLYANSTDGLGGINPVQVTSGKQKIDIVSTYKAAF